MLIFNEIVSDVLTESGNMIYNSRWNGYDLSVDLDDDTISYHLMNGEGTCDLIMSVDKFMQLTQSDMIEELVDCIREEFEPFEDYTNEEYYDYDY